MLENELLKLKMKAEKMSVRCEVWGHNLSELMCDHWSISMSPGPRRISVAKFSKCSPFTEKPRKGQFRMENIVLWVANHQAG